VRSFIESDLSDNIEKLLQLVITVLLLLQSCFH